MSSLAVQSQKKYVQAGDLDTGKYAQAVVPFVVRSQGLTDQGQRASNQDQFLVAQLLKTLRISATSLRQPSIQRSQERGHLFAVADGVGGNVAGEEASALALLTVEEFLLDTVKWFLQLRGKEEDQLLAEFQQALGQADAALFERAAREPQLRGMSTTMTLALLFEDRLFVAHAGDSRCYLLRGDKLYRLTQDHTLTAELVRAGQLPPEEAEEHPYRNVLTNALGGRDPGVQVDVHKLPVQAGDCVLLCSDGLVKPVDEPTIARVLRDNTDPHLACEQLMAEALNAGADDNVTVVVAYLTPA